MRECSLEIVMKEGKSILTNVSMVTCFKMPPKKKLKDMKYKKLVKYFGNYMNSKNLLMVEKPFTGKYSDSRKFT